MLGPLPAGFALRFDPLVLPVSLSEYRNLFMDNSAPYFHTSFLSENGSKLVWLDDWFDWTTTEGFKDHHIYEQYRRVLDLDVERVRRFQVFHTITPNPFAKEILLEGLFCQVRSDQT